MPTARPTISLRTKFEPAASGFLTVYPCGSVRPTVSNLNVTAGVTRANFVNAVLSGGKTCIYAQVSTDVLVDVSGAHSAGPGLRFQPIEPSRAYDSRLDARPLVSTQLRPTEIGGAIGVPKSIAAAQMNLTTVAGAAQVSTSAFPGFSRPGVSNVNYPTGSVVPNAATVMVEEGDIRSTRTLMYT